VYCAGERKAVSVSMQPGRKLRLLRGGNGSFDYSGNVSLTLGATHAAVIDGDAFYAGGIAIRDDSAAELASACIDWPKQRAVLEQLKAGKPARYRPFDWEAFDGSLEARSVLIEPKQIVILEGVYSARLEFSDLLDMRILLQAVDDARLQRLLDRRHDRGLGAQMA